MGKFSKLVGTDGIIVIGEDEFKIKSLTVEHIPLFFKAMKAFSGAKEDGSMEDMFKNMDDTGLNAVTELIKTTLELSYPDEDANERAKFGLKYMSVLLPKIFEINSAQQDGREKIKLDKIKALQTKRDAPKE